MKTNLAVKAGAIIKKAGLMAKENSPVILTAMAVGGVVATVVLATNATIKAKEIVDEAMADAYENEEEFGAKDIVMATWKLYVPVVVSGVATISCIIGAQRVQSRRTAAFASLYSASQEALKTYQEKVKEQIGENKERKVREDILQDTLDKNPVDKDLIIDTGMGTTLCFDVMSGRYFWSDAEKIRQARNEFNHDLLNDFAKSLNDWYYYLNLDSIWLGEAVGWTTDKLLELRFTSRLSSKGDPCLVIEYQVEPSENYRYV